MNNSQASKHAKSLIVGAILALVFIPISTIVSGLISQSAGNSNLGSTIRSICMSACLLVFLFCIIAALIISVRDRNKQIGNFIQQQAAQNKAATITQTPEEQQNPQATNPPILTPLGEELTKANNYKRGIIFCLIALVVLILSDWINNAMAGNFFFFGLVSLIYGAPFIIALIILIPLYLKAKASCSIISARINKIQNNQSTQTQTKTDTPS